MNVKRQKKAKSSISDDEKIAALGAGIGLGSLALAGDSYQSYKNSAKKSLEKAVQSGIDSPAIDKTKEAVNERIKRISKNKWKDLRKMQNSADSAILEKNGWKSALELSYGNKIPQNYKDQMRRSINASESIQQKIKAAANLKDAKLGGKVALAVGIPSASYLAYKKYKKYKNKKKN